MVGVGKDEAKGVERMTESKTEAVRFEITWTEARHAGRMTADTWEDFNTILSEIASEAPSGGAYHKTGFRITFEDGETYEGRYDVQNIRCERPDVSDHVRRFVGYHSGLIRPSHLTEDDYAAHLKLYGEETRRQWYELARCYDVGVETPDDDPPALEVDTETDASWSRGDQEFCNLPEVIE
jgi:hypothetical protein